MFLLLESLSLFVVGHGLGTGSHVFQDGLKQYIVEDDLEFLLLLFPLGLQARVTVSAVCCVGMEPWVSYTLDKSTTN